MKKTPGRGGCHEWIQVRAIGAMNKSLKTLLAIHLPEIALVPALLGPLALIYQTSASAAGPPPPQASKWVAQLPEGNGKRIVVTKCQFCHTLEKVVTSNHSKDKWKDLVTEMIDRGARLKGDEPSIVVDYLTANFGPTASDSVTAPPSEGVLGVQTSASSLVVDPDQAQFSQAPETMGLPTGTQVSVLSGDPAKAGMFSILLKLPAGLVTSPSSFSADENIVCLRGNFQFGQGDCFDPSKLHALSLGTVVHVPAQTRYFFQTKESTIVLVYGSGPLSVAASK